MTDVVDQATRSRMMSGIRGQNTKPELMIRKGLHAKGFRFRLHAKGLPGKPDLVLPKHKAAIFVHGCFWHGHDCGYFKVPQTRTDFWLTKIGETKARDKRQQEALSTQGWRVMIVWECAVRAENAQKDGVLIDLVASWLINGGAYIQIDQLALVTQPCSTTKSAIISKVLPPNT